MLFREYFPTDFDIFKNGTSITLFLLFLLFLFLGFFIIYKQVALVKKGEFTIFDLIQCVFYGVIFSMSVMVVLGMAFIFAVNTPSFWEPSELNPNPASPPDISPLWLMTPVLVCLAYISFYPLVDFLYIALSEESDEGLTPFHKFLGENIINRWNNKSLSIISAIGFYLLVFIAPPLMFYFFLGFPFITIYVTWMIAYPLMILTFYGAKGWIAGFYNVVLHIEDLKRSIFIGFEDGERTLEEAKDFPNITGPRILMGLMLFVYVWAWISMMQTLAFYFTGSMAISTYSYAGMVFVTLLMGIVGYFTRFWGRKIKYRTIDTMFAAYLMAAVGINVLANFLIVNPEKLADTFNYTVIGFHELIPNFLLFAFAAVIEEVVLIIFTTFYLTARSNEFTENIKFSKITECGQIFDPIPLFNLIKSKNPRIRKHAEETILLMYERIPLKADIDINQVIYKNPLIDGITDPNPNSQRICYQILLQLEKDMPQTVLPWIKEALTSPNYDKSIPFARSLLDSDTQIMKEVPKSIIFSLINDPEWRLKRLGVKLLAKLAETNEELLKDLELSKLVKDPDSKIQVEVLEILANSSIELPIEIILEKLNHTNREIRAAAIKNIKNLNITKIDSKIISKIIPLMRGPAVQRAAIFETFAKIGNFRKHFIPILPLLDGLTDSNDQVRGASVLALRKYFEEEPDSMDIDIIIDKIDPNDNEVLNSVLSLLGSLWEQNPEKILTVLLIFIKFDNEKLKENISEILVDKYELNPQLIIENLIEIPDVAKFVTKGIIAKTIIEIAKKDPENVIPRLIEKVDSNKEEIRLNALSSLDGLIDEYIEYFKIKPFLMLLQKDSNKEIKKEATKIISKLAKRNPKSIKPQIAILLQSMNQQEGSVKIILSKAILEIAKDTPDILPIRPIISFLADPDSFIRETGAKILGQIGFKAPDEVSEALITKGLSDKEWIVRDAAASSLGKFINHVENKEKVIQTFVTLLDDEQSWVRRTVMNILSEMEGVKASQIPFEKVVNNLKSKDPKVREASAGLLKIYGYANINRVIDHILILLEDEDEGVRKSMINAMVDIIQKIGIEKVYSKLLKNLSDEGAMEAQRSIALILRRTVRYADEKIKKRAISLLKIRCEMSQDPIICETLALLRES